MLSIIVGAQFFCGMSSITSASRMMYAFSRDRAVPGHQLWRQAERRARAVHGRDRDRGARVPLRVPGVLRHQRRRRVRRGHVDRDDRPLHRVRDPDLPAAAPRRRWEPGEWNLGKHYKWIGIVACLWVVFISILFMAPLSPAGIPWNSELHVAVGQLRADRGARDAAARRRAGGWSRPGSGSRARSRRARRRSSRGSRRSTSRRAGPGAVLGVGSSRIPDRREPARAGSLHEGGPRADARRAARRRRRSTP